MKRHTILVFCTRGGCVHAGQEVTGELGAVFLLGRSRATYYECGIKSTREAAAAKWGPKCGAFEQRDTTKRRKR